MACNLETITYEENDIRHYDHKLDDKTKTKVCERNSHESDFISFKNFNDSQIAEFCKEKRLLTLVQTLAQLCVKISVRYVSAERQNVMNKSNFYKYDNIRPKTGSGTILKITERNKVEIYTAKHVVFYSKEAEKSLCRLNYDGSDSNFVTLQGTTESLSDIKNDWCKFQCEIEDNQLPKIRELLDEYDRELVNLKRKKFAKKRKAILISHPHGCYKYISMGDQSYEKDGYITYETPSCVGSSGGFVLPIGYRTRGVYVHAGIITEDGRRLGCSSGEIERYKYIL